MTSLTRGGGMMATVLAVAMLLASTGTSLALDQNPTMVSVGVAPGPRYSYLVNGQPQLFVGMGYNPIYGQLAYDKRAGKYYRDFKMLCEAGVNTITGWDSDKGYQQDTFDELTLDSAYKYNIGVVMPFYLPVDGNYADPQFTNGLMEKARTKVLRYKNHPALRMWGVGNEVLIALDPDMASAFMAFYLRLADEFHQLDPNHPVIYRDAEDRVVPAIAQALRDSGDMRPWLLYGMNIYDKDPGPLLSAWPGYGLDRPLLVSEFGSEATSSASRAQAYASMWRSLRDYPDFVLGGAPYVWTTAGPEPTDATWGLMNADAQPVDDTFARLRELWRAEPGANRSDCR